MNSAMHAEHWVYFLAEDEPASEGGGRFVKIGVTTDPTKRIGALRTGSARELFVLAIVPLGFVCRADALLAERSVHTKFAHLRSHGEWFRFSDEIYALASTLSETPEHINDVMRAAGAPWGVCRR